MFRTFTPRARASASPLIRATVLMVAIFVVGSLGYHYLGGPGYTWLDAFYMTAITLTTVGFNETIDLSGNPAGRVFTMVLLVAGVGSFVYFFSQLMGFVVEGSLDHAFLRVRMRKQIAKMTGHHVVCGAGHTGTHVVEELVRTNRPVVLVERDEAAAAALYDAHAGAVPYVIGDAAEDEILREAGVERAAGVVTCFSNDKDNLIVAFSSRALNPSLRIVCRCVDERVVAKMRLAGADAVVSPNTIGGLRMVSELVRPRAVSFLDAMLREHKAPIRVEEVTIGPGSPLADLSLRELRSQQLHDVLIVAAHFPDGTWRYNPDGTVVLEAGTTVIFIGSPEMRERFDRLAQAPPP